MDIELERLAANLVLMGTPQRRQTELVYDERDRSVSFRVEVNGKDYVLAILRADD